MRHVCPEHIVALFKDEQTAMEQGRPAALAWLDAQALAIGDEIYLPEVGGKWRVFVKTGHGTKLPN